MLLSSTTPAEAKTPGWMQRVIMRSQSDDWCAPEMCMKGGCASGWLVLPVHRTNQKAPTKNLPFRTRAHRSSATKGCVASLTATPHPHRTGAYLLQTSSCMTCTPCRSGRSQYHQRWASCVGNGCDAELAFALIGSSEFIRW